MVEGEKEQTKEKRKKKKDSLLSGQEPTSGTVVDVKPPVTEVCLPADTETVRFLHSSELTSIA